MRSFTLLILILTSGNLFAQTVKKIRENPTLGINEKFYVLKSDHNIKEGPYAAYSLRDGSLLCEGFYKNNSRDSIWTSYDFKGQIDVKYDYIHKKLLQPNQKQAAADKTYNLINGTDTLKTTLDQPPICVDGINKIYQLLRVNIHYPVIAKEENIQGKVIIAFTIDKNGVVSNYRVKKAIGGGCDEMALNTVKLIEGDWLPGIKNGQPVTVEFEMPVSFAMTSSN